MVWTKQRFLMYGEVCWVRTLIDAFPLQINLYCGIEINVTWDKFILNIFI